MKYSFNYYIDNKHLTDANEIIIRYHERSAGVLEFIEKQYPGIRIVADMSKELNRFDLLQESLDIFKAATQLGDFAVKIFERDSEEAEILKSNNIPFFTTAFCNSWDRLKAQIDLGVSDVYITEELMFDLKNTSSVCHEAGVQIRIYPNVAQQSGYKKTETFKSGFVLPQHIKLFEPYVDIFEFFLQEEEYSKQDVLYKIYRDERWDDDAKTLIKGLKVSFPAYALLDYCVDKRLGCQKKCYYSTCTMCERALSLAQTMGEKGYKFD